MSKAEQISDWQSSGGLPDQVPRTGSTVSAAAVGEPHKGDAVMIEESLPCLPGPLYRAVPQRIVGDGRSPRLRRGCGHAMQDAPDTLCFQTSAVHEGYAPKSDLGSL